jgi:hypothetical protein
VRGLVHVLANLQRLQILHRAIGEEGDGILRDQLTAAQGQVLQLRVAVHLGLSFMESNG